MNEEKRVVVVRDKESVVVRGIERKLKENEYFVFMSGIAEDEIRGNVERAAMFITYLPADIIDNIKEIRRLETMCSLISEGKRRMVVIGEKKYHDELLAKVPAIRAHPWIDRPLDMDELMSVMEGELNRKDEPVVAPVVDDAASSKGEKRILVVDDDPAYARMVREWLKDIYKVDIVTAGMQAITFLAKNKVDMILLDYEMPIADGPQVLEMLRSEPAMADIPVIFLTGVGDLESVKRVMALKPQGYILKSTTKEDLRNTIKTNFEKLSS